MGAAAQQAAEPLGKQHRHDGTDVRGEFLANARDRERSVEQRNALRGEYRADQPAFADRARASAILREAHQPERDHAKFHDHISGEAHERRRPSTGIDQNIGSKARLFFRYQRQVQAIANGNAIPYNAAEVPSTTDNFTVGYTQTVTPSLVNDFRIGRQGLNTNSVNYFYVNGIADAGTKLGIAGFDADTKGKNPGTPEFNVSGFSGWGNSGTNWFQTDSPGRHPNRSVGSGGITASWPASEFRKLYTSRSAANSPRGVFNFNGQFTGYAPADFMMGFVQNLVTPTIQFQGDVATWRDGFFVLDNWQASGS